jgi:plasmid stabilization system protein ParE
MVKRKIIWSDRAAGEFKLVLEFYNQRNGSKEYSTKLLGQIEALGLLLLSYPSLGHLTKNKITRVLVKGNFMLFYEVTDHSIEIVSFWDARQNPEKQAYLK